MSNPFFIVNAFTQEDFGGNPAAVCPLTHWLKDKTLQNIAAQNNLSETAYIVPSPKDDVDYEIRWFTPTTEVDLCGHATLATASVIFNELGFSKDSISFECQVGMLTARKQKDGKISMNFPTGNLTRIKTSATFGSICRARPLASFITDTTNADVATSNITHKPDLVLIYETESQIRDVTPHFQAIKSLIQYRSVIVSAPGDDSNTDFVCRMFAPNIGIDEDPVTGSAYTLLAPFWAQQLQKTTFEARQHSARGGRVWCELVADANSDNANDANKNAQSTKENHQENNEEAKVTYSRVSISGFTKPFAKGELFID